MAQEDARLSKGFRKFLKKHGAENLNSMELFRVPISKVANTMLQLVTAGKWDEIKKRGGVDRLYHTYAIINQKYLYEKTAIPVLKEGTASSQAGEGTETLKITVPTMTINDFIAAAIRSMGEKYFEYDAFNDQSCQDYLIGSLKANGMLTADANAFLKQDVKKLVEETPTFSKWLAKGITDTAGDVEHTWSTLTDKRGGIRHRLEHHHHHRRIGL
jgi:hypothetical protein